MEQAQSKILEELYALRAGLSVISQEADKIPTIEEVAKREYSRVAEEATAGREQIVLHNTTSEDSSCQKSIGDFVRNVALPDCSGRDYTRELQQEYAAEQRSELIALGKKEKSEEVAFAKWLATKQSSEYYERMRSSFRYSGTGCKKVAVIWTVLCVLCVIAIIVMAAIGLYIGIALPAIAFLVCFVVACFYWSTYRNHSKKGEPIREFIGWLSTVKIKNEQIENERCRKLGEVKDAYRKTFDALENRFSSVLDVRDWKYVDLVIYYFETGRAETMKEALQLVEREVQTQRIVGAIETATERICRTIERSAAQIVCRLDTISTQLSVLIGQQEMQNALLAKANVTSERLMSDVNFIKTYSI